MAQPKFPSKISPRATVLTAHQHHTASMVAQAGRNPRLTRLATNVVKGAPASRARGGKR